MKLQPMRRCDVNLALWKWEGAVVTGGTPAAFKRFAKRYIDADVHVGDGSMGHAYVEYGRPWLLWVDSLKNVPTLAHEAVHIASGILEGRGLKWSPESEEAYTYTVEAILRAALAGTGWRRAR